jgi:hypothetical protein
VLKYCQDCKEGEHVKKNINSDSESQGLVKIIHESDIIKNLGLTTPHGTVEQSQCTLYTLEQPVSSPEASY